MLLKKRDVGDHVAVWVHESNLVKWKGCSMKGKNARLHIFLQNLLAWAWSISLSLLLHLRGDTPSAKKSADNVICCYRKLVALTNLTSQIHQYILDLLLEFWSALSLCNAHYLSAHSDRSAQPLVEWLISTSAARWRRTY